MAFRSRFVAVMILTSTRALREPPDPHEGLVVEEAQELRLARQRRLRDLVEEERAAVRDLDEAAPRPDGAGEGPALVTEQLALEERLADRRAVHLDERALPARALGVEHPRHQLLARAALAGDEHRAHPARRELTDQRPQRHRCRRGPDHLDQRRRAGRLRARGQGRGLSSDSRAKARSSTASSSVKWKGLHR